MRFSNTNYSIIENCTLSATLPTTGSYGIYFNGASSTVPAEGNSISGCTIHGANSTTYPLKYGIQFGQYCKGNMIFNNTVYYCEDSCSILNESPNNIISGNVFRDSKSGTNYGGIYLYNSDFNVITDNQCTSCVRGIYLRKSSGCTVQGNICNKNSESGIRVGADSGTNAYYNSLVGNICHDNSSYGIFLASNAKFTVVDGNNIRSSVTGYTGDIAEESSSYNDYNLAAGNIYDITFTPVGGNSLQVDNKVY